MATLLATLLQAVSTALPIAALEVLMGDRPSTPLLKLLRDLMKKKGLNTAAAAKAMGVDRARARKVLAGAESMMVDELLSLGEVLDLAPEDLALPLPGADAPKAIPGPRVVSASSAARIEPDLPDDVVLDGFGNHPEQLFRAGIALGCDFMFLVDVDSIADSGAPPAVLKQYEGRELPIKLDAAYHSYNNPRYAPDHVLVTLSFDALYECTFSWSAFRQFIFFPVVPEAEEEEPAEESASTGRPVLRLVT